jgi:hypothetical protein
MFFDMTILYRTEFYLSENLWLEKKLLSQILVNQDIILLPSWELQPPEFLNNWFFNATKIFERFTNIRIHCGFIKDHILETIKFRFSGQ